MASLKDRLEQERSYARGNASNEYQELKTRVHRLLIPRLPLAKLETAEEAEKQTQVNKWINLILNHPQRLAFLAKALDQEPAQPLLTPSFRNSLQSVQDQGLERHARIKL